MSVDVRCGDALSVLRTLPAESVHMCCTSPPYFSLRDYNHPGQIGLEPTPEEYISRLVDVFREVRRVLHRSGTLWVVMGDSYSSGGRLEYDPRPNPVKGRLVQRIGRSRPGMSEGIKPKDLIGIPWMLAFALRADGWYLRSDIIWAKKAPMPESVTDRPTKAHEYIFLLSKSHTYFYDADAIREPLATESNVRDKAGESYGSGAFLTPLGSGVREWNNPAGRNKRSVWWLGPESYDGAHFATFPTALVEPCILAGTSEYGCCPACLAPYGRVVERTDELDTRAKGSQFDAGKTGVNGGGRVQPGERYLKTERGWQVTCRCNAGTPIPCTVLDCFAGSGTVGQVAVKHRRDALLIELNPSYVSLIDKRLNGVQQTLPLDGEAS